MGELILVEYFEHCGFFAVSGIGRIRGFTGGRLWDHNMVISGGGSGRGSRLYGGIKLGGGRWVVMALFMERVWTLCVLGGGRRGSGGMGGVGWIG